MTRVGESVTSSFSRPYHHRGRIPLWVQVNPSRPYIRGGNVLEACGDFVDKKRVEGSIRPWRSPHRCRKCWRCDALKPGGPLTNRQLTENL